MQVEIVQRVDGREAVVAARDVATGVVLTACVGPGPHGHALALVEVTRRCAMARWSVVSAKGREPASQQATG